jgi:pimeloyl-ACP methyl ester carboxylesterase
VLLVLFSKSKKMFNNMRLSFIYWLAITAGPIMLLAGCVSKPTQAPEIAPVAQTCPEGVPTGARCLRGQDSAMSHYLIVMPANWSGVLVVHAHGGPSLGTPQASRADEDTKRWAITVQAGHAWAGSVFRQGGFAVTTAAQDTERVRQIFVSHVAKPRRTVLHGQSWGAMVATRAGELFPNSWDGILLTSGVVAGPASYDFRLDLRAIYQHLCNNLPLPDEPQYSLGLGLPADAKFSNAQLIERADACLGVRQPAAARTASQAQKLKTIVDVLKIPESSVISHLNWGVFTLRDVVSKNGGASPLGNQSVRYTGSSDDAALNAGVPRFTADAKATASFAADVDYVGKFTVPVLTAHGIDDATVFVESHDILRQRMAAAGNSNRLVQTFVNSSEHSYWGDAFYPPLFEALLFWIEKGQKPTPASIQNRCKELRSVQPGECRFVVDYQPKPLTSRVFAR